MTSVSSPLVATTLLNAAGEANTSVASTATAASPSARAVSVRGFATSMSGTTEEMPAAGP